jgi:hypothetical protein
VTQIFGRCEIANYTHDAIDRFYRAMIINGRPDGNFDPQGAVTRAELATMLSGFVRFSVPLVREYSDLPMPEYGVPFDYDVVPIMPMYGVPFEMSLEYIPNEEPLLETPLNGVPGDEIRNQPSYGISESQPPGYR